MIMPLRPIFKRNTIPGYVCNIIGVGALGVILSGCSVTNHEFSTQSTSKVMAAPLPPPPPPPIILHISGNDPCSIRDPENKGALERAHMQFDNTEDLYSAVFEMKDKCEAEKAMTDLVKLAYEEIKSGKSGKHAKTVHGAFTMGNETIKHIVLAEILQQGGKSEDFMTAEDKKLEIPTCIRIKQGHWDCELATP